MQTVRRTARGTTANLVATLTLSAPERAGRRLLVPA